MWPKVTRCLHGRRSDWNSGGGETHGGTFYKNPAVEAKNTFSYIVMQVI